MTPAEYGALVDTLAPLARKHGITRLVLGDVEMEFAPPPPPKTPAFDVKGAEAFRKFMDQGVPTEEDILMHSAAGYVPTNERPVEPTPPPAKGRS